MNSIYAFASVIGIIFIILTALKIAEYRVSQKFKRLRDKLDADQKRREKVLAEFDRQKEEIDKQHDYKPWNKL